MERNIVLDDDRASGRREKGCITVGVFISDPEVLHRSDCLIDRPAIGMWSSNSDCEGECHQRGCY